MENYTNIIKHSQRSKQFKIFAKVVRFRQIWSHFAATVPQNNTAWVNIIEFTNRRSTSHLKVLITSRSRRFLTKVLSTHLLPTLDCWSPTCSLWHFSRLRRSPSQLGGFLRLAFGATNLMRIKWAQSIRSENTHILHSTNVKTNFFFKKKWANPGFFFVYFRSFSNKHYYNFLQQINVKNVMSIQYTALGFEPTTFGSRASSHNH